MELWDAADYLVRTGQAEQAVPYLNQFLKSNPDDATLMRVRDRYGVGSILRLQDYLRPAPSKEAEGRPGSARRPGGTPPGPTGSAGSSPT